MDSRKIKLSNELYSWHFFILTFIVPITITFCFFNSSCYAFTGSQITDICDECVNKINSVYDTNFIYSSSPTWNSNQHSSIYTDFNNFLNGVSDYNYVIARYGTYNGNNKPTYEFWLYEDIVEPISYTNLRNKAGLRFCYYNNDTFAVFSFNSLDTNSFVASNRVFLNNFSYYDNNGVLHEVDYVATPTNSVTLTALHSGSKLTFIEDNQLKVELVGYDFDDFVFFVLKYDSEYDLWREYTGQNDFYQYIHDNDPPGVYYVYWGNINYWDLATYKYACEYIGNDYPSFSASSGTFEIEPIVINNSVSGFVDSNGDISIDIDNSNSVNTYIDYFGKPVDFNNANISNQDIENSLNIVETVNPYSNFLMTFINGLTSCMTDTVEDSFSFKVHSWGQTFTFNYQDFIPTYPTDMRVFLTTIWTVVGVILIVKWTTRITEAINVGDVSTTLELIEEKYSNLL